MNLAEHIVERLLETGEGDPNYQDDQLDKIVQALARKGFRGAYYKEFDAYQGVYLMIPGVDKLWIEDRSEDEIVFTGEQAVKIGAARGAAEEDRPYSTVVSFFAGKPEIEGLIDYLYEYHGYKLAHRAAQRSAEKFMRSITTGQS